MADVKLAKPTVPLVVTSADLKNSTSGIFSEIDLRELIWHFVKKNQDCPHNGPCRIKDLASLRPSALKQLLDSTDYQVCINILCSPCTCRLAITIGTNRHGMTSSD
jgi:hypothetical protein